MNLSAFPGRIVNILDYTSLPVKKLHSSVLNKIVFPIEKCLLPVYIENIRNCYVIYVEKRVEFFGVFKI